LILFVRAGKQASRQAGKRASGQAGKQASGQAGKQASGQAGKRVIRLEQSSTIFKTRLRYDLCWPTRFILSCLKSRFLFLSEA